MRLAPRRAAVGERQAVVLGVLERFERELRDWTMRDVAKKAGIKHTSQVVQILTALKRQGLVVPGHRLVHRAGLVVAPNARGA